MASAAARSTGTCGALRLAMATLVAVRLRADVGTFKSLDGLWAATPLAPSQGARKGNSRNTFTGLAHMLFAATRFEPLGGVNVLTAGPPRAGERVDAVVQPCARREIR